MPKPKRTHREVKDPQISARLLADYMAGSERAARAIVRSCKYQPIARVVQHNYAKATISSFLTTGDGDASHLFDESERIRSKISDSDFDQTVNDHNADYVARFARIFSELDIPPAERLPVGDAPTVEINGVKVTVELAMRLRRTTRTNKIRTGAAALRYVKGKPLKEGVALWHAAFIFAYLGLLPTIDEGADPEHKLCLIIDGQSGACFAAPSDSVSRFRNMEAALASIAERWPNVAAPAGAVL